MISVIYPITTKRGTENLKRNLASLEVDRSIGLDFLILVNNQDLFLEVRDFAVNVDSSLVVYSEQDNLLKVAKEYLTPKNEYVFLANENIILPPTSLVKLYEDFLNNRCAGFISGEFQDRPTVYWVENVLYYEKDPKYIYSNERKIEGNLIEVDTISVYGLLTRLKLYNEYFCMEDLDRYGGHSFGVRLRRSGYQNYVDTRVKYKTRRDE